MFTFKDKVTERLSRLFTDSPNSSPSPSPSPSPDLDHNPKARPYYTKGKSLASIFSFYTPFGGSTLNKSQDDLKPIQSLPVRWNGKKFQQGNEQLCSYQECSTACDSNEVQKGYEDCNDCSPMSVCENKQASSPCGFHKDNVSQRNSTDSDVFEEAFDQPKPQSSLSNLIGDSTFISQEIYEFLNASLPNIVLGRRWVLLYSTSKHGISLRTLIRKSAELSGPCLLIAGDMQGAIFGGLLECPLKPTAKRKYQGTYQTFVFTTIYGEPRIFRATGANRYYYLCLNDMLAFGGGGNFALRLDEDLLTGTSGSCETFGNLCLAHSAEFELKNVELWGFAHGSLC